MQTEVFPGHHLGPHKWLSVIQGVIDTAQGYLSRAGGSGVDASKASALVRDAERLGKNAYRLLRHMEGSGSDNIPHQVVGPFQRWVDGLRIKNTIFFRADHVPNYELLPEDLRKFVRQINDPSPTLLEAVAKIEWPMLRVTLPSHAMGMLPHFAVVAHELGHAIQHRIKFGLSHHGTAIRDTVLRIESRLGWEKLPYGREEQMLSSAILASWVEELKSDAIGHYLVGPAFYFALSGFLELVNQGYGIGPTHPPSRLRRTLLLEHLEKGKPSFRKVLESEGELALEEEINSPHLAALPSADILYKQLSIRIGLTEAAICVELIPLVELLAPDIFDAAHAMLTAECPDMIYTPETLRADLQAHLKALVHFIPPIESGKVGATRPSSLASILNVGWVALLSKIHEIERPVGSTGDLDARQMERLHELLLKGVELSDARQLWDAQVL